MTTGLACKTPTLEVTRVVAAPPIEFDVDCTPQPIYLTVHGDVYTDAQFYADLKKASKWIDSMEEAALKEHAEGKTRKLP